MRTHNRKLHLNNPIAGHLGQIHDLDMVNNRKKIPFVLNKHFILLQYHVAK